MLCAVFYLLSVLFYHYYVTHTTSIASIAGRKECEKGQAVKSILLKWMGMLHSVNIVSV